MPPQLRVLVLVMPALARRLLELVLHLLAVLEVCLSLVLLQLLECCQLVPCCAPRPASASSNSPRSAAHCAKQ